MRPTTAERSAFTVPVYSADDLYVVSGANLGDPVSIAEDLDLDDTYEMRKGAEPVHLSLAAAPQGRLRVARASAAGTPGATVCIDCCLTVMSQSGITAEILVLVEVTQEDQIAAIYALPLAALAHQVGYTLVSIDRDAAQQKFAQAACVSFTRGTRITLATGEQRMVQDLVVGDRILTRDDGAQPLRWIGHSTQRAVGNFAPVLIRAGALNNEDDLRVSPDHRLFVYQRADRVGAGRAELLVRARHLINNESVVQDAGGFVDYYQLLFDTHQIIYAEGIAAETLLLDRRTQPAVPQDLRQRLTTTLPQAANSPRGVFDMPDGLVRPDLAALLKGASTY
ncbi:MAG: Hint domain-containing protein [Pseudomonadota bacterium]